MSGCILFHNFDTLHLLVSWFSVSLLQVQKAKNARNSMHQHLTCDVVKWSDGWCVRARQVTKPCWYLPNFFGSKCRRVLALPLSLRTFLTPNSFFCFSPPAPHTLSLSHSLSHLSESFLNNASLSVFSPSQRQRSNQWCTPPTTWLPASVYSWVWIHRNQECKHNIKRDALS